jgi:hypothetical protein
LLFVVEWLGRFIDYKRIGPVASYFYFSSQVVKSGDTGLSLWCFRNVAARIFALVSMQKKVSLSIQ